MGDDTGFGATGSLRTPSSSGRTVADDEVVLVHWPRQAVERQEALRKQKPCLLLVEAGIVPPVLAETEDWAWEPVDPDELLRRIETLRLANRKAPVVPVLEPGGIVRSGDTWVVLPIAEIPLAELLIDRFDALVTRSQLVQAAWPSGGSSRGALHTRISRLRTRLAPLGLVIQTIRTRGFVLTWRT